MFSSEWRNWKPRNLTGTEGAKTDKTTDEGGSGTSGTPTPDTIHEILRCIKRGGAAIFWSGALQDRICWVCDERVRSRIQAKYPGLVIYTLAELMTTYKAHHDIEQWRLDHLTKGLLGSIIIAQRPN